ncbi:SPOR domain-containing protein [Geobacter sp.]|uniref:SPOR domain-containing protein n=1 Tax=Geobacter sp. TaxID=46610 RepID=UPI002627B132|nr:SPOR domain-containing protein [Geobacter sp.]
MVVDYRERRQVSKNRPKSKPVGMLVFGFVMVSVVFFALGVAADRLLLRLHPPKAPVTPAPQAAVPARASQPAATAAAPPPPPAEPSLTFYNTLPKGGQAILGSGINPRNEGPRGGASTKHSPSTTSPPKEQAPSRPSADKVEAVAKPTEAPEKKTTGKSGPTSAKTAPDSGRESGTRKPVNPKGKFSVQAASTKDRKEAEAIKARLAEKGFAAYIVESSVPGKGSWYRIRVGKQMEQPAASEMASMVGGGAIIVPE